MRAAVAASAARVVALVACIALTGCGDKDAGSGGGKGKKSAAKKVTVPELFAGTTKPALLGPFAGATLGMSEDELRSAAPVFAERGEFLAEKDFGVGFFAYLDGEPKRLSSLRVTVPATAAVDLAQAWGPPIEITYMSDPTQAWFDPGGKVRAFLAAEGKDPAKKTLILSSYLPVAEILGAPRAPLAIEAPHPFLGATIDEIKAAYPTQFKASRDTLTFLEWPPDEYGDVFKIQLTQTDTKIIEVQFWVNHGENDAVKKDRLAMLETKYGPAKEVEGATGKKHLVLGDSGAVRVDQTTSAWVVQINSPR